MPVTRWKLGFLLSLTALSILFAGCGSRPGSLNSDSVFTSLQKQVARIELEVVPSLIPADGITQAAVLARLFDDEGKLAPTGTLVQLTFSGAAEFGTLPQQGTSQFGIARVQFTAGTSVGGPFEITAISGRARATTQISLVNANENRPVFRSVTISPGTTDVVDVVIDVPKAGSTITLRVIDDTGAAIGSVTPATIVADSAGRAIGKIFFAPLTQQQAESGVRGFVEATADGQTTFFRIPPPQIGGGTTGGGAGGTGGGSTAPTFPNDVVLDPPSARFQVRDDSTLAIPFTARFPQTAVGGTARFTLRPTFGSTGANGITGFFTPCPVPGSPTCATQDITISANGTASTTLVLTNVRTSQIGSGIVLAVNVDASVVSNGIPFQFAGSAPVTLLPPAPTLSLLSFTANPTRLSIPAGGNFSVDLVARVQAQDGSFPSGIFVNFSSDQSQGVVFPTTVATDASGIATATFSMNQVPASLLENGLFVTLTAQVAGASSATDLVQTTSVFVTPSFGAPDHLVLSSSIRPNPTTDVIFVLGSVFPTVTQVTFDILDINDNVARSATDRVEFVLENGGVKGGESLAPGAAAGGTAGAQVLNGRASTVLRAGVRAGTVRIIAFIDNLIDNGRPDPGEPRSEPITVSISGGLPAGQNFSIVPTFQNIPGLVRFGISNSVTAFLADRFNNPVLAGTRVSFTSFDAETLDSAARVSASGVTATTSSIVTGTLVSQQPSPPSGFVGVQAQTNSGTEAQVIALAQNPADPNTIFAGSDGGGVYRGIFAPSGFLPFGNMAWQNVGTGRTGLENGFVRALTVDPRTGQSGVLFAGTELGVFRSTGSGGIWIDRSGRGRIENEVPAPAPTGNPAEFDLAFPSTQRRARTFVFDDGVRRFDFLYESSRRIRFLGTTGLANPAPATLRVSYDYDQGIPQRVPVTSIAVSRNSAGAAGVDSAIIYAGTLGAGVFRSINGGFTWVLLNSGLDNLNVVSLALARMPGTPADVVLLAGTQGGGVFKLSGGAPAAPGRDFRVVGEATISDADVTAQLVWTKAASGLTASNILALATDPDRPVDDGTPFRVFAGTDVNGVFRTTSNNLFSSPAAALTWEPAGRNVSSGNLSNTRVTDIEVDPASRHVFATTIDDDDFNNPGGGLFRSTDFGGQFWPVASPLSGNASPLENSKLRSLAVAGGNTWVGGDGRQVWLSRNASDPVTANVTFTEVGRIGTRSTGAITVNPVLDNNIYDVGRVLFSGFPLVTLVPLDASISIPVGGSQSFLVTVADENGNPLPATSEICASSTRGEISLSPNASGTACQAAGEGSFDGFLMPDSLASTTDFVVVLSNDEAVGEGATLNDLSANIQVTAAAKDPNTKEIVAEGGSAIARTLSVQQPLTIVHITPPTDANTVEQYIISGGSGTFVVSSSPNVTIVPGASARSFSVTTPGNGTQFTLRVDDVNTGLFTSRTFSVPSPD